MIPIPRSYFPDDYFEGGYFPEGNEFAVEEIRKVGTNPFFRFTVYPNYFDDGIGADSGTHVNTTFVSPDRIQVDYGSASASWTSAILESNSFDFPASVAVTWDTTYPGYSIAVEYRTATTGAALSAASWTALTSGDTISLYEYYQWRVTFTGIRCWAFDDLAGAEASSVSAWAIDTDDPDDPYRSFASDSEGGLYAYIENAEFDGELRLPDEDILDGGVLSLPVSTDFSELISGDHTMKLLNRRNRYSPRHPSFIFADENNWQRKNLKINMGFKIPACESEYPPEQSATYVKATSYLNDDFWQYFATDPDKALDGWWQQNCWLSQWGVPTNQRLHIAFEEAVVLARIYYENAHTQGMVTDAGAKNFTLWGSNSAAAFADTAYGNDTGWSEIGLESNQFAQHVAVDQADPQYIQVTTHPPYKYFAVKIADNWGNANYLGLRRIELQTLGENETDTILLYVGNILKWGPVSVSISKDGYEAGEVEIYSRDAISLLMDQKIGTPDEEGNPAPVVCGRFLREATKLGENSLYDPVRDVDFESGSILHEVDVVDTSGAGNTFGISTEEPYEGTYCVRAYTEAAGEARGWIYLPNYSDNILFKTRIRFDYIPAMPCAATDILRVHFGGGDYIRLTINNGKVALYVDGTEKDTEWNILQNQGVWADLALGIVAQNPGAIRLTVNGEQVINYDKDDSGNPLDLSAYGDVQAAGIGLTTSLASDQWEIFYDNCKLWNSYYPEAYYIPGAPFDEIGTVYSDGIVKVEKKKNGVVQTYSGGLAVDAVDMTKYPDYGLVVFDDFNNPPSSPILMMVTKDDNIHPVDAIEAVLAAVGRSDIINADSFAEAKAARPDDSIGCYFENISAAEAILAIAKVCLLDVIIAQGEIKLISYDGAAPESSTDPDWDIDDSVCAGLTITDDAENLVNRVVTKWGQYDQNNRLFYEAKDQDSIDKIGAFERELSFAWGQEVGSDNADMAKSRADCLLNRLKGSLVLCEDVAVLPWQFIRAEIGDTVKLDLSYFGTAEIDIWELDHPYHYGDLYRIVGKEVTMAPPYEIKLTLAMYPGES